MNLETLAKAAQLAQKVKYALTGATHLFEEPGDLEEVARLAASWFLKHLGRKASQQEQPPVARKLT